MSNFTNDYQLAAYECNQERLIATATIFNWLQDSMDKFSRACGVGYDFCHPQGVTYFLKAYDVQIDTLPRWADYLQMRNTLSNSAACSLFLLQDLYNKHTKQRLLSAVSHVVLIDFINKRPAHIKNYPLIQQIPSLHTPVSIEVLKPLDTIDTTHIQEITYDHIDFNQHVNNTNYVVFAERTLDPVFLKKNRLKRIQVAYKQAAVLGDKLRIDSKITPSCTDHQISSATQSNRPFARVRFSWMSRNQSNER